MFAILIHIYYHDSWERIFRDQLMQLKSYAPVLMVNLCKNSHNAEIIAAVRKDFPDAYLITTPNKGKDIGGKLALMDLYIRTAQQTEYVVFLHDKISPHSITGERWRTKLFTIIDPLKIKTILKKLDMNTNTGIIGAQDFIKSEFSDVTKELETTNRIKINTLVSDYKLTITNYTFVAGTMFWVRSAILKNFFSVHRPLQCREILEEGDFTDQYEGTYAHSWERIFCWLATSQNYTIEGI